MNAFDEHKNRVETVSTQMKDFYKKGTKVKIFHGSTNSTRAQNFEKNKYVDVSKLDNIIEINKEEEYVLVEPNVPMDILVGETTKYGLIPPVVMEFPGITVGGGVQGGAGESSSFKYGLFHDICLEYEIVLGNGDIVTASETINKDLFYGTACSYGSLGVITLVKLRLIPVKEFIRIKYYKVSSFEDGVKFIENIVTEDVDVVDAIFFSKDSGVVMVGSFSDQVQLPKNTFSRPSDEWFYLHVDKISKLNTNNSYEEIIPTKEYLFRYDRGGFWMGYHAFRLFHIPFSKLTRRILNRFFHTRTMYRFLHATNLSQRYFVQDISLPKENVVSFLNFANTQLGIYPLWLCPLRPGKQDFLSPNTLLTDLVINVGIWGEIKKARSFEEFLETNRRVENEVKAMKGRKVLYAHAYYSEAEFWSIYNRARYDDLREKYLACKVFPDVYQKTKVSEKYKQSIARGVLREIFNKFSWNR